LSANSSIEWTKHTFNISWGCVKSSPGCDHCYAESWAKRYGWGWGPGAERRVLSPAYWAEPLKWNAAAAKAGTRDRVFCSSMTDVFLNDATIDQERTKLWPLIRQTPHLDWLLLTKHPERFKANLPDDWGDGYPNVVLMVSVENNDAKWRVDILRKTPAPRRGLSVEPMLGRVNEVALSGIHWVIAGGESGAQARPMHLDWVRELRDRCVESQIAFFLKQLGGSRDKRGGEDAVLDDRRWMEYPRIGAAA
jgi:protein gp37